MLEKHINIININILGCSKAEIKRPCSKLQTSPTLHRITKRDDIKTFCLYVSDEHNC